VNCDVPHREGTIRPDPCQNARPIDRIIMSLPRRLVLIVAAPAAVALALTVACSGSTSSRSPADQSATAAAELTPRPSPTATPAPADAELAASLRYNGEYEQAIDVYGAVATAESGQQRQDALFAQAQLLAKTRRLPEARAALEEWIANAGPTASAGSPAQFMLASTLDDLGDEQGALSLYEEYIEAGGPADDYARIERAKLLARLGRGTEAEAAAEAVLAGNLAQSIKASFTFSMAAAFEQAGADANALAWYNRVKVTPGGDVASALARTGNIKKRLGDATWTADYLQSIASYPGSGAAPDMLAALDAAGTPVSDYVRGVVDYRARSDAAAREALASAAASGDHAAEATYYIGAIDERAGDTTAAIDDYARVPQLDATSPLAADALWWRGKLQEASGAYADAEATYRQLATQYPASDRAADAAFRQGLAAYRAGDTARAIAQWADVAASSTGDNNLRARFWQGRALYERSSSDTSILRALMRDAPDSFYALRAGVLLEDNDTKDRSPKLDDSAPDWKQIARYVAGATGTDPDADTAALSDPRWAEAAALADVGLGGQSDGVFVDIMDAHATDAAAMYQVTKKLSQDGRTSMAARAATRLLALLTPAPRAAATPGAEPAQPPDDLLRVAYPVVYKSLVIDTAKEQKVSPLLLLALVRQESYYDPDAGSVAGALGLTQVVPATGESIAKSLDETNFTPQDLFRPNISLRFGAHYLAGQLADFKSDAYRALAAYNGGPGTASNAAKAAGGDEDLFVEDLEFDETQTYVKRVMENYARYRQLYEHLDEPSLPQ